MPFPNSFIASMVRIATPSSLSTAKDWPYLDSHPHFAAVRTSIGNSYFGKLFRSFFSFSSFVALSFSCRSGAERAIHFSPRTLLKKEVWTTAPFS